MYSYIRSNPFQSTLPRGSDVISCLLQFLLLYFNPRSLAGATLAKAVHCFKSCISIHAPSRERLITVRPKTLQRGNFNPRSLAGATSRLKNNCRCSRYFNPRSLAGATKISVFLMTDCLDFNPRSLAGATTFINLNYQNHAHFNPRSLAGATSRYTECP